MNEGNITPEALQDVLAASNDRELYDAYMKNNIKRDEAHDLADKLGLVWCYNGTDQIRL